MKNGTADLERVTESTATDLLGNVSVKGKSLMFLSSRSGGREAWIKGNRPDLVRGVALAE